jgi:hypothetical protein
MVDFKKGNILSHNQSSTEALKEILLAQKETNRLLGSVLCSLQVMVEHLEEITGKCIED